MAGGHYIEKYNGPFTIIFKNTMAEGHCIEK
jgi:hypothetical protein